MVKRGLYITLESGDGGGKTSQLRLTGRSFEERKIPYIITREPGGTRRGEQIRKILLDRESKDLVPKAEFLLYAADRAQHTSQIIIPAVKSGKVVLGDRAEDSSLIYQGFCRGINEKSIIEINKFATEEYSPDLTIIIAGDAEYFLRRAWRSAEETDDTQTRFEEETLEFHKNVMEGFLDLAKRDSKRYAVVWDLGEKEEIIQNKIRAVLESRVGKRLEELTKA